MHFPIILFLSVQGNIEQKVSQALYADRKCPNYRHHYWNLYLSIIAAFLVHVRTITRYVRCREHLATIKGIGPDSVTVSTHLLQQTIYCLLCYVTQKPFLCFPPCVVCKELVCTDDSPIARFSQGIIRPRPSECGSVLLQKLKLEVEEMKQRKKMKVAPNYRSFQIFPEEGNALNSKCKNNFLGIQINSAGHPWHHLKFTSLDIIKHHKCSLTEVI